MGQGFELADLRAELPITVHRYTRWLTVVSRSAKQK